ncbi:hypothetical protein HHI36_014944 [Cryptolaemus montrouzieri]|uniref:DDE Tnp4 domain-containing protein n=1 Tax=Cryptolaemus montrouzieri TaxID=559131 RepID=A0ABD2N4A7_9CUCU
MESFQDQLQFGFSYDIKTPSYNYSILGSDVHLEDMESSGHSLKSNSRAYSISGEKTILIFLWFAGQQSPSYRDVSRKFRISIGALFRIISDVSQYLNSIIHEVVKWPSSEEQKSSKLHYLKKSGLPSVIGCIGNSNIRVTKPLDNYVHCWESDKNFRFVLQGVCNEKNKFIDIFVGSPGVIESSMVFKNSPLCKMFSRAPGDVKTDNYTEFVLKTVKGFSLLCGT